MLTGWSLEGPGNERARYAPRLNPGMTDPEAHGGWCSHHRDRISGGSACRGAPGSCPTRPRREPCGSENCNRLKSRCRSCIKRMKSFDKSSSDARVNESAKQNGAQVASIIRRGEFNANPKRNSA